MRKIRNQKNCRDVLSHIKLWRYDEMKLKGQSREIKRVFWRFHGIKRKVLKFRWQFKNFEINIIQKLIFKMNPWPCQIIFSYHAGLSHTTVLFLEHCTVKERNSLRWCHWHVNIWNFRSYCTGTFESAKQKMRSVTLCPIAIDTPSQERSQVYGGYEILPSFWF
jgi:hypothetical protein